MLPHPLVMTFYVCDCQHSHSPVSLFTATNTEAIHPIHSACPLTFLFSVAPDTETLLTTPSKAPPLWWCTPVPPPSAGFPIILYFCQGERLAFPLVCVMYFMPSHLSSPATPARDLSGSVGSHEAVWFLGFTFFPHLVAVLWCKWGERAKKVQKKASVPMHCQPSLSQAMPAKTWPPSTGAQRGSIKVTGVSEDDPAELRGRHKTGNKKPAMPFFLPLDAKAKVGAIWMARKTPYTLPHACFCPYLVHPLLPAATVLTAGSLPLTWGLLLQAHDLMAAIPLWLENSSVWKADSKLSLISQMPSHYDFDTTLSVF